MAVPSPRIFLQIDTLEEDVYCLTSAKFQDTQYVLTGHGNGIVKIWSKDGILKQTIKIPITTNDVTCICATPTILAVSVKSNIVLYDPKQLSDEPLEICKYNTDEINQLCISPSGNYLLSCDDSGQTIVIDISIPKKSNRRVTCRYHDMCLTVAFYPHKHWQMITGGLDSHIVLWDYSRGRPLHSLDIKQSLNGPHYINPPMIHSICTLPDKPLIAAGLGNGHICLLHILRGKINVLTTKRCHSTSIGSVISYSLKEPLQLHTGDTCTDVIVSGGNDSNIILSPLVSRLPIGPNGLAGMSVPVYKLGPEPLHVIQHGSKVNWMEVLDGWSQDCTIIGVADQTSKVTLYSF